MHITPGRAARAAMASLAILLLLSGCSEILNSELPPEVRDPATTQTAEGAVAAYNGTRAQFARAFGGGEGKGREAIAFVGIGGMLGDELQVEGVGLPTGAGEVDMRSIPELGAGRSSSGSHVYLAYSELQKTRAQAGQAVELLRRFAPDSLRPLAGHLYALQGFAEIFLAELYCSGIPLSTVDFDGDYTVRPGSSTDDVYGHALALLDTAVALAGDSSRFVQLARIGQARALLGRGEFAEAALIAAQVPDNFRYEASYSASDELVAHNFAWVQPNRSWAPFTVADREGLTGLDYRTSNDPRTRVTAMGTNVFGFTMYHPDKYATDGSSPIVVASGVEARLIEAEAALRAGGGSWLTTLNALRTDGTFTTQPNADDPAQEDTLWNAGTGGVAGLAPLQDPGNADARVNMLFRERGFWLFLTGHRQGDMRRLIRHYGRTQQSVYPSGSYPGIGQSYGGDVTLPIPPEERSYNSSFTGCISREA